MYSSRATVLDFDHEVLGLAFLQGKEDVSFQAVFLSDWRHFKTETSPPALRVQRPLTKIPLLLPQQGTARKRKYCKLGSHYSSLPDLVHSCFYYNKQSPYNYMGSCKCCQNLNPQTALLFCNSSRLFSPHITLPLDIVSTLYSWMTPFWWSGGGGSQEMLMLVLLWLPTVRTVTDWGGALGAAPRRGNKQKQDINPFARAQILLKQCKSK